MIKAQLLYINQYSVDISKIYSTSTLSLRIFRQHFQKYEIPILNPSLESFIRRGYFGGWLAGWLVNPPARPPADYYKAYVEGAFYADVNSLNSDAMLNPMPVTPIKYHQDLSKFDLNKFFGWALAEIYCPKDIIPVYRTNLTVEPNMQLGNGLMYIFSEELKK